METNVIMVTKATWRFHSQSLQHAEIHVGLHVQCPIQLSSFNKNWNVLTNTPQYHNENPFSHSSVVSCEQKDR
jgi:hypothetical protein